jgi:6-phosphogluconolactonase
LGDDGHTASLIPGTTALTERTRKFVANFVPKFNSWRLTTTLPMINQARHVFFLVNSNKHAALIERVLAGDRALPASQVKPADGELTWILGEPKAKA